jgi:hypothetical protein
VSNILSKLFSVKYCFRSAQETKNSDIFIIVIYNGRKPVKSMNWSLLSFMDSNIYFTILIADSSEYPSVKKIYNNSS